MRKIILGIALIFSLGIFANASVVNADAAPGDTIIVLGEDLTEAQKDAILKEMGVENPDDALITTVSNEDEHKYLGDYIPAAQIGSNAISSAIILIGKKGDGLSLESNNINYVTDQMYGNALSTAGLKDAEIYITAPFEVSGTGALTGIIQAYEISSGVEIDEANKEVANEEMVLTSDLAENETIGEEEAVDFISKIKKELSDADKLTKEELEEMIKEIAKDNGFDLTKDELSKLIDLFRKFQELDIDWDVINQKVGDLKNDVSDFINSEEGASFIEKIKDFFASIVDFFANLFDNSEPANNNSVNINEEPAENNNHDNDVNDEENNQVNNKGNNEQNVEKEEGEKTEEKVENEETDTNSSSEEKKDDKVEDETETNENNNAEENESSDNATTNDEENEVEGEENK